MTRKKLKRYLIAPGGVEAQYYSSPLLIHAGERETAECLISKDLYGPKKDMKRAFEIQAIVIINKTLFQCGQKNPYNFFTLN